MAKCAGRSSTSVIQLMLLGLLMSVYWCMDDKVGGRGFDVPRGSDKDDVVVATMAIHCSSATIFGLLTANCATRNISSVKQLRLDHHGEVVLRADNRLIELGPDEFYRVVPHLQQLYLATNFIAHIDEHAFRNIRSLQVGSHLSKDLVAYTLYVVAYPMR